LLAVDAQFSRVAISFAGVVDLSEAHLILKEITLHHSVSIMENACQLLVEILLPIKCLIIDSLFRFSRVKIVVAGEGGAFAPLEVDRDHC